MALWDLRIVKQKSPQKYVNDLTEENMEKSSQFSVTMQNKDTANKKSNERIIVK